MMATELPPPATPSKSFSDSSSALAGLATEAFGWSCGCGGVVGLGVFIWRSLEIKGVKVAPPGDNATSGTGPTVGDRVPHRKNKTVLSVLKMRVHRADSRIVGVRGQIAEPVAESLRDSETAFRIEIGSVASQRCRDHSHGGSSVAQLSAGHADCQRLLRLSSSSQYRQFLNAPRLT